MSFISGVDINFTETIIYTDSELSEIKRNILTLMSTPMFTIPMDRSFGIDYSCVDSPIEVAKNTLSVEIIDKIEIYEPRVTVKNIAFEACDSGQFIVKIELGGSENI